LNKVFLVITFIMITQCINVGDKITKSPQIKNNNDQNCNYESINQSKKIKSIIRCKNGYQFEVPEIGYDQHSCKIESYSIKLKGQKKRRLTLMCNDFRNERQLLVY